MESPPKAWNAEFQKASFAGVVSAKVIDVDANHRFYLEYRVSHVGSATSNGGSALILRAEPLRKTPTRPIPVVKISAVRQIAVFPFRG